MSLFDFSKVDAPVQLEYLKPGTYVLSVSQVDLEKPENKTPYLNITFSGKDGMLKQKFYLTPKAFPALQYLHEGLFGKPLTKAFDNLEQIHAYFQKALTAKKIEKVFLVGGQEADNGRVYAELPYGRFLLKEGTPYEEGAYEEGSARWKDVVRKNKLSTTTNLGTDDTILPSDIAQDQVKGDGEEDMPW